MITTFLEPKKVHWKNPISSELEPVDGDQSTQAITDDLLHPVSSPDDSSLLPEKTSVTADCLKVSIEHLLLERLDIRKEHEGNAFYALAQNIFQFNLTDRENVYRHLQLDENNEQKLRRLHDSNQMEFEEELSLHIQFLSQSQFYQANLTREKNLFSQIADQLEINLIILEQQDDKQRIIEDNFSTAYLHKLDHPCFQNEICVAIAEEKKLFTKESDQTIHLNCCSQSISKTREVTLEFSLIRKYIVAVHQNQQSLQCFLDRRPCYTEWIRKYIIDGVLDDLSALSDLSQAESEIKDFIKSDLKQELKKFPLAVIISSDPEQMDGDVKKFQSINLEKLEDSALEIYSPLSLCQAVENILDFIDHKKLTDEKFEAIYIRSRIEVQNQYQRILQGIFNALAIQEIGSIDDKDIVKKLISLKIDLQYLLPRSLRDDRSLAPYLEQFDEIAVFLKQKNHIKDIADKIVGKKQKRSEVKAILRQVQKSRDFRQTDQFADQIQSASPDAINKILFQAAYEKDWNEELEKCTKLLQEVGCPWSMDDDDILDLINFLRTLYAEEKTKERYEKSLEGLCKEYADSNKVNPKTMSAIQSGILDIRLNIKKLKQGEVLLNDSSQQYPLGLIADICVKFEKVFGDMLRDTQLLAILSMLDSSKGSLSQVKTGEGKSYIIAALAIIKCKQGQEVDVITSSPTLARRDLDKFKEFYWNEFGIFSAHNCDLNKGMMANPCYQRLSIVYGTAASFEGDSLRSEFYQSETFNGRERGVVILDEADSALLDKSGWLCQISDAVAGMSTVKPIFYYIMALVVSELNKKEQDKTLPFLTQEDYDDFVRKIKEEVMNKKENFFSGKIKSFGTSQHLQPFATDRIPYWVDNALKALSYTKNKQYNLDLGKIIPIDYANTGEWENDVQWEDGLHQFLQILNGLEMETETLTKSFMSNYSLMKKYRSIYGLSGTCGDDEEAKTIDHLYGIAVRKIPTFKVSRLEEKEAWICAVDQQGLDTLWLDSLYTDVMQDGLSENPSPQNSLPPSHRKRLRATLIICNSILDVKKVENYFKEKGIPDSDIVTYTKGNENLSKIREATKGKVIIATNLAGRGTDIEASSIENAGGLHVIVSFLPANRRIQDQAFGRTARKGLAGTARLIIKFEELEEYHIQEKVAPLLKIANDITKSNLIHLELKFQGQLWIVISDQIYDGKRVLEVEQKVGVSEEKKSSQQKSPVTKMKIQLTHSSNIGEYSLYDSISINGMPVDDCKLLQVYSAVLNYETILKGRNRRELERLNLLVLEEQKSLDKKQHLFEAFQARVHQISQTFQVDNRLNIIKKNLLELYKSYVLDEWAIFLDKTTKNIILPDIEFFEYAKTLAEMIEKNDLYKMQYVNASIDVVDQDVYSQADDFYKERGQKKDITAAFACYNRALVILRRNKSHIQLAKDSLNLALAIFKNGEEHETGLLQLRRTLASTSVSVAVPPSSLLKDMEMDGTQMLKMIRTMKALIGRHLKELEEVSQDYDQINATFGNLYELRELPRKANPGDAAAKNEDGEEGYLIPDSLMQEAIRLGFRGALTFKGEGTAWLAIIVAIICVILVVAVLAFTFLSGGALAPFASILLSTVFGGAVSGAIDAVKGAVNGDFSFRNFGKSVLVGLVTGMVGGAVGAGGAALASKTLLTASPLGRIGIQAAIGVSSGAMGVCAGYPLGEALHGRKITIEGFAKAFLQGCVGGGLGGFCAGFATPGINNVKLDVFIGAAGGFIGNAVKQGIDIAMGDRKEFDGFEFLENGLVGGLKDGVMGKAKKEGKRRRAEKQTQNLPPSIQSQEEGKESETILKKNSNDKSNLDVFNDLEDPKFSTTQLRPGATDLSDGVSRFKRTGSGYFRRRPNLFPNKRWSNHPPAINDDHAPSRSPYNRSSNSLGFPPLPPPFTPRFRNQAGQPTGYEYNTQHQARSGALNQLNHPSRSVAGVIQLNEGHQDGVGGNRTSIYATDTFYDYHPIAHPGVRTNYVAVQHHPGGHDENGARIGPHYHLRPARQLGGELGFNPEGHQSLPHSEFSPAHFTVDSNGQLPPEVFKGGVVVEHFFYP